MKINTKQHHVLSCVTLQYPTTLTQNKCLNLTTSIAIQQLPHHQRKIFKTKQIFLKKKYPVLVNTSMAAANAPTPGNTNRLAFRISSGVCT